MRSHSAVLTEDSARPAATVVKAARRQRALASGPGGIELTPHGPRDSAITIPSNPDFCPSFTSKETEAQEKEALCPRPRQAEANCEPTV